MFLGFRWRGKYGDCEGGEFALGSGGFLNFVELFCSLWAAGPFLNGGRVPVAWDSGAFLCRVEWFRSLRAAMRFISHRRTRPGWGRSPPRPQHPRLPLSPSPLRGPLGLPRPAPGPGATPHPCGSRPLTASMPSVPTSRARLGEGDGVQHPRDTFRFSNVTEVSL